MLEYGNEKSMNFSNTDLPFSPEQTPSIALNSILSFLEWAPDRREALKQNAADICLALQIPVNHEDTQYLSNILETILEPAVGPQFFDTKNSQVFFTPNTNEVPMVPQTMVPPYNNDASQLMSQSNDSDNSFHQRTYANSFDTLSTQQASVTPQNLPNANMSINSSGFGESSTDDVSAYVRTFNEMFLSNNYKIPSPNMSDMSLTLTQHKPETTNTFKPSTTDNVNSFSMVSNPLFDYPKYLKENKNDHVLFKARDNRPHDENQSNLIKATYPNSYWNSDVSCSKSYDSVLYKEKDTTSSCVCSKKPTHTQMNNLASPSTNPMMTNLKSEPFHQKNMYIPIDYFDDTKSTNIRSNCTTDSYIDSCVPEAESAINGEEEIFPSTTEIDATISNLKKLLNFDTTIDQSTLETEMKFVECISYCNSLLLEIQSLLNGGNSKNKFLNLYEIENLKDNKKMFVSDENIQDKLMWPHSYRVLQNHCTNFKSSLDTLKKSSMRFLESCPAEAFLYFSIQILQCFSKFQSTSTSKKNTDRNPFLVLVSPVIEKLALNFNKALQEQQQNENRTDKTSIFLHPICEPSSDAWNNKCYSSRQLTNPDTPSTRSRSSMSSLGSPKKFHKRQRRHFSKQMHHKRHLQRKRSQSDMERIKNFPPTIQPSLCSSEGQENKDESNNMNTLYNTTSTNSMMSSEKTHNSLAFDLSDALFAENELLNRIPPHLYRDVPLRHTRCNTEEYYRQSSGTLKGETSRMYNSTENRCLNGPVPKHISPRDKLLLQMPDHIITRTGVILPPLNSCLYLSKVVGVVWDRIHNSWVVNYTFLGKRYFQHFPAKKYGFLEGRQYAIELRLAKDQEKSLIEGNVRGGGRRAQGVNLQSRGSKSSWKSSLHRDPLNSQLARISKTSRPFRRTTKNSSCTRRYRSPKKILTLKESSTNPDNTNDKIEESEITQTKSPELRSLSETKNERFLNSSKSAPNDTNIFEDLSLEASKDGSYTQQEQQQEQQHEQQEQQEQQQPCLHQSRPLQNATTHNTPDVSSDASVKTALPLVKQYKTFPSTPTFEGESSSFTETHVSLASISPSLLTRTSCRSKPLQEPSGLPLDYDQFKSHLSTSSTLLPDNSVSQIFSLNALQTSYTPQNRQSPHAPQCTNMVYGPSSLNSSLRCESEETAPNPYAQKTCQELNLKNVLHDMRTPSTSLTSEMYLHKKSLPLPISL